jgi:hypothetical protein
VCQIKPSATLKKEGEHTEINIIEKCGKISRSPAVKVVQFTHTCW